MGVFEDLRGQQFNRLYPFYYEEGYWWCLCECEPGIFNLVQRGILAYNLKKGNTKSCGCFTKEQSITNLNNSRKTIKDKYQKLRELEIDKIYNYSQIIEVFSDSIQTICKAKCLYDNCGNIFETKLIYFKTGETKSCGCLKLTQHLPGETYNYYIKIKHVYGSNWLCKCVCGKEKIVSIKSLQNGNIKSCGCIKKEIDRKKQEKYEQERQKEIGNVFNYVKLLKVWTIEEVSFFEGECLYNNCGNIFQGKFKDLKFNKTKSCGCLREKYYENLFKFYDENGYFPGYFPGYLYQWRHQLNQKLYVGRSIDFVIRDDSHVKELKNGTHHSKQMQEDFDKDGIKVFERYIIAEYKFFSINELNKMLPIYEKQMIDLVKPVYNTIHASKYNKVEEQNPQPRIEVLI